MMKTLLVILLCLAMLLGVVACVPRVPEHATELFYIHPDMPPFSFLVQGFLEEDGFHVFSLSVSNDEGYYQLFEELNFIRPRDDWFPVLEDFNQDGYMDLQLGDFIYLWNSEQHEFLRSELLPS